MPQTKASTKHSQAPAATAFGLSQPSAVARRGPIRSGVSVPRRKSPTSLNRLVPIWMKAAPSAAASSGSHRRVWVSYQATAVPTSTGDSETDSVLGRQARNQAVVLFMRWGGASGMTLTGHRALALGADQGQARAPQIMRLATKWRAGGQRSSASRPRPRANLSGTQSLEKALTILSVKKTPPWRSRRRLAG